MRNTALEKEILECTDDKFNDLALKIFHLQYTHCEVYRRWIDLNGIAAAEIDKFSDIPYLPVSFFKTHEVRSVPKTENETIFYSSSTSNTGQSRHFVKHTDWYESVFLKAFELFYGRPEEFRFLALLPSYLDRSGSSLVYMMNRLISEGATGSGFFNKNLMELEQVLHEPCREKTILFGVTYALLDLAALKAGKLPEDIIVMDTGGMKGQRQEMIRAEIHNVLCRAFGVNQIHSEYGMTELMSQAYSQGEGIYHCPPWMRVSILDATDPGQSLPSGKTGRVCVTDLANIYSCSFIATDDLGKVLPDGAFELAGRLDFSDVRGCNLMWSQ